MIVHYFYSTSSVYISFRAEIQKEYRERENWRNDSTFVDKERRHYRVPVAEQDESTLESKRRKNYD